VYATVDDLRAEGITEAQASDSRLLALIDEASCLIDHVTGWFFEPREMVFRMDGHGVPSIEPPAPPIELSQLRVNGSEMPLDSDNLIVIGAPVQAGFYAPRLSLCNGLLFPSGQGNIYATGLWGYTEDDGTTTGRVPLAIRRACMLLVLRNLPLLSSEDEVADVRNRWRVIEEKTRDQSYKLDRPQSNTPITSDPEIDSILYRYRRPAGLGAA